MSGASVYGVGVAVGASMEPSAGADGERLPVLQVGEKKDGFNGAVGRSRR